MLTINSYDEYGIPDTASGNDVSTKGRFRYTGQAWIPEIGMYHYKARIYSPTLGRFLQTDPIGYEDQYNLYACAGNDPVNAVDPSGMCQTTSDSEGNQVSTGICGFTENEQSYIDERIADENSATAQLEADLIAEGKIATVEFVVNSPIIAGGGVE